MSDTHSKGFTQMFRLVHGDGTLASSSPLSGTVKIEPRFDNKVGGFIILWNDITAAFKNPIHIRDGDTVVPFLTDKNFEFIEPRRIRARPGVILDVVLDASEKPTGKASDVESLKFTESLRITDSSPRSSTSSTSSTSRNASRPSRSARSRDKSASRSVAPNQASLARGVNSGKQNRTKDMSNMDSQCSWLTQNSTENLGIASNSYSRAHPTKMDVDSDDSSDVVLGNIAVKHNDNYKQGLRFYHGKGAKVDYHKALEWFQRAASEGHVPAHLYLGFMHENAMGMPQDNSQTLEWYITAGYRGYDQDMCNVGMTRGSTQSHKKAIQWYGAAAEKGDAKSQCRLGFIYQHCNGKLRDHAKAMEWYRRAANQGYDNAQNNIGLLYYNGNGVPRDYSEAMEWFLTAALQGHARAQSNLGIMYQRGHGVSQNVSKAAEWYRKAAAKGNDNARTNLEALRKQGFALDHP
ncbi:hypothetical protein BGX26_004439 [Mortierella sp. AD094]|nr:hypothetical protein BGX26_004439 [Mortierella sp. AD094]